ncbi:MAG: transketolase [Kiritimatiellia bacterium]
MNEFTQVANTIRGLAMDGVQKAKSGHPGMPMGMADVAAVLYLKHLNYSPVDPSWPDRDRFVLSAGHGSMLLYSMLHLAGYDLPLDELKKFRQWGSKTPGHPEYGHTAGVETTTGPLGQGIANAVGMAIGERMLADRFNTTDCEIVNHRTYVICGDGCMMEGISHEACSLAGHLGLSKLVLIYDYNRITIEGNTSLAYSDDVRKRFEGYHWNVLEMDAHDLAQIDRTLAEARNEKERPTLIIAHSTIGKGAPKLAGSHKCHGEPLGEEEIAATKKALGLPEDQHFFVSPEVRDIFAARAKEMEKRLAKWKDLMRIYREKNPEQAGMWEVYQKGRIPSNLDQLLPVFDPAKPVATRNASGLVLQKLAKALPFLAGGAADLAPSTKTYIDGGGDIGPGSFKGVNFHFGIREHAMAALLNGLAQHGGLRVFGSTFFSFLDYCKSSVRLSAIMKLPVIYVFTHDSFYVGEDGPTHEPVEQTMSLRLIPGMTVLRPADATETSAAWIAALKHKDGPTAILLTRQNLPVIDRKAFPPANSLEKGAYILWDSAPGDPELILMATGSEVSLALEAARQLAAQCKVRVVSMPSWEYFEKQDPAYKQSVLPDGCRKRVAIEAGSTTGWQKYTGCRGAIIGLDDYGASAPYQVLAEKYGFTPENVVRVAQELLAVK